MLNIISSRTLFFLSLISEWNKFDLKICDSARKHTLNFIRPRQNSIFKLHNQFGIKLLTHFRVGLSHLKKHKFKHNFQDSIGLLCCCGANTEPTIHFFLHCINYAFYRQTFISK